MGGVNERDIQGKLNVSRDINVGGDIIAQGGMTVGHNLKVEGFLEAPNLKTVMKGLFRDDASLRVLYPRPEEGWYALVGDTLPAYVWVAEDGEWRNTGEKGGDVNVDLNELWTAISAEQTAREGMIEQTVSDSTTKVPSSKAVGKLREELDENISKRLEVLLKTSDGIKAAEKIEDGKYVAYATGAIATASTAPTRLYIIKNNKYSRVRAYMRNNDITAVIAFFSGDYTKPQNYIKASAVSGSDYVNHKWYEASVPSGTEYICVCGNYENEPNKIELIEILSGSAGSEEPKEPEAERVIKDETLTADSSKSVLTEIDISGYEVGTKFRLEVKECKETYYYHIVGGRVIERDILEGASVIEFEKYSESFTKIRLWRATSATPVNLTYRFVLADTYKLEGFDNISYMPVDGISIKDEDWIEGYWKNNLGEGERLNDPTWICTPLQKSNGFKLKIEIDYSTYYVNFAIWKRGFKGYGQFEVTQEANEIDLSGVYGWHINIRRKDRESLTGKASEVLKSLRLTTTGEIYERPLTSGDIKKTLSETESRIEENLKSSSGGGCAIVATPFVGAPHYYHYEANGFIRSQEGSKGIASQSVADIETAARLGFKFIEANIHKTSDGRYVCIHGTAGKFGPEVETQYQTLTISETTLDFIKSNIRYCSDIKKYQTSIPTLEEFCEECRNNNIGIFAGVPDNEAVKICVKYLGESNVIVYNPPSGIREHFKGYVFQWWNSELPIESLLYQASIYGAPYMCGLGEVILKYHKNNGTLDNLISEMHKKGYLIGVTGVYDTETNIREALRRGCDFNCAGHEVNPFESNYEIYDISISTEEFSTEGSYSEGVVTMTSGQSLSCGSENIIALGKGELRIRFKGTLKISFGSLANAAERTIKSDGSEEIILTDYFFRRHTKLTITANEASEISELVYKTSRC